LTISTLSPVSPARPGPADLG